MFDLTKSISLPVKEEKTISLVLFYQTEEYKELMEEVFRFEGVTAPVVFKYSDDEIRDNARDFSDHIIMIELNETFDVTYEIELISHLLPTSASVIVIGSENSISTIRTLRTMGYYYLFWPINKLELIDFIRGVNEDISRNSKLKKSRQAKRVAIWGTKGGVGTSFIAAQLSKELSEKRSSSCLVVDHNFSAGNLDIMMGIKQFKRRLLSPGMLSSNLDVDFATSMATKINDKLSLLAIESEHLSTSDMQGYVEVLTNQLAQDTNFIIEDLSGFASERLDFLAQDIEKQLDVLVLVIEQSVSSLREASLVLNAVNEKKLAVRVIVIVNQIKPEKYSTVDLDGIEKYIDKKLDVLCPFEPKLGSILLRGESVHSKSLPISRSLSHLTSLLLGETPKKLSLFQRLTKRIYHESK